MNPQSFSLAAHLLYPKISVTARFADRNAPRPQFLHSSSSEAPFSVRSAAQKKSAFALCVSPKPATLVSILLLAPPHENRCDFHASLSRFTRFSFGKAKKVSSYQN